MPPNQNNYQEFTDQPIDNSRPKTDNDKYNVQNVVVRRDEMTRLNDPDCDHSIVKDSETIGDYQAWKCTKCHKGRFLPKSITKIT